MLHTGSRLELKTHSSWAILTHKATVPGSILFSHNLTTMLEKTVIKQVITNTDLN